MLEEVAVNEVDYLEADGDEVAVNEVDSLEVGGDEAAVNEVDFLEADSRGWWRRSRCERSRLSRGSPDHVH